MERGSYCISGGSLDSLSQIPKVRRLVRQLFAVILLNSVTAPFPAFDTLCIVSGEAPPAGCWSRVCVSDPEDVESASESRGSGGSGPPTGRPRSEEAHKAILTATVELLAEVGFSGLTVEGVAQRAGVGKATIYRRWPSKVPLVVEAYGRLPGMEDVDTGRLADDLKGMLQGYLEAFVRTPLSALLPSLAGERAHNAELAKVFDPISIQRRMPLMRALKRGVERGEIDPETDLDLAADMIVGPIAVGLFFKGGRIHPKRVGPMVDLALAGLRVRR